MSERDPFDFLGLETPLSEELKRVRATQRRLFRRNVSAEQASELTLYDDLEKRLYDDNGILRLVVSALDLVNEIGVNAYFALLNSSGAPQVWASADDGSLAAMAGNWKVDSTGQSMTGLLFPLYFIATNAGEQRQAWLGLSLPQGGSVPVFSILFTGPDGANLVTNGDGTDETGWTDSDSMWEVISDEPYSDSYPSSFRHYGEAFPGLLLQNVGVTAGEVYSFGYASYLKEGILSGFCKLKWKNGGGSVIQTDTLYGSGGAWNYSQQSYVAPATAASVDIEFDAGDPFNDWRITAIQFFLQSVSNELRFGDGALTAIVDGVEYDLLSFDKTVTINSRAILPPSGKTSTLTINTAMANNHFYGLSAADAADGDEYTVGFVIRAGTYSLIVDGALASNAGKVDYYIDDVLQSSGQDWYAASSAQSTKTSSISVLTSGYHVLKIKVNGKHASSTDFRWLVSGITIVPASY